MRISIEAEPIGPLSILSQLPEAPLAVLEGLNGIGKSLAVRILQVCTGSIPYSTESPVWQSLCRGLGPFTISISSLEGAEEVIWTGDTRRWIEPGGRTGDHVLFEDITIDGATASIEDVRALLNVHRIAGDEGILDTFAGQADATSALIRGVSRRLTAANNSPLADLEHAINSALNLVGSRNFSSYDQLSEALRNAADGLKRDRDNATEKHKTLEDITKAADLHRTLEELRVITPGIEQEIRQKDDAIRTTRSRRDKLLSQITELAAQVSVAEPWLHELQNAQRTLARNRAKLSQAHATASASAQPLGVAARESDAQELSSTIQAEIAELQALQSDLDATPIIRATLRAASDSLSSAENRGLGEHIAVDEPETGSQLTISQTNRGMNARIQYLDDQPPMPEMQELSARLQAAQRRLSLTTDLLATLGQVRRFERLVSENEERVAAALEATDPNATSKLRQLENARRECDEQLMELASQRAALSQQLGPLPSGATEASLLAQLNDLLGQLGMEVQSLENASQVAQSDDRAAQELLRKSQDHFSDLRREMSLAQNEIRTAVAIVADGTELTWLRTSIPERLIPSENAGLDSQVRTLDAIRNILTAVDDRLGALRAQMGAVEAAFETASKAFRRDVSNVLYADEDIQLYIDETYRFLSDQFSRWFNDPRIRREILPFATSDITVDAMRRDVTWREGSQQRSRPLEAFSSGQQAFAYTRAQLAVIDDEPHRPLNRLIVLDEFGSFIAHDLLTGLLNYLVERTGRHAGDQVLVILPLSTDYQELAERASGEEKTRLERLADSVQENNYLVRVLAS